MDTTEVEEAKPSSKWQLPKPSISQIYAHHRMFSLKSSTIYHEQHGTFKIKDSAEDKYFIHLLKELDSYPLASVKKGFNFMHLGYVQISITPLVRKGLNASCIGALLDTRHRNFNDQLISVIQGPLSNGPIYIEIHPNYLISLIDPYFQEILTFMFKSSGLDLKNAADHVMITYRLIVRVVNTTMPSVYKGLSLNDEEKGHNIMVKVDPTSQKQVPEMIAWEAVSFPQDWQIDIRPTLVNELCQPQPLNIHRIGDTS